MSILQDQSEEASDILGAKMLAVTLAPDVASRKTRSATTISVMLSISAVSNGMTMVFARRPGGRNSEKQCAAALKGTGGGLRLRLRSAARTNVVPAQAGTYTPRPFNCCKITGGLRFKERLWLWVLTFVRTTSN